MTQSAIGTFSDRFGVNTANSGPWLSNLARLVDVARFRYQSNGRPATPVYNFVGVHAWFPIIYDANGVPVRYADAITLRPPTPEEVYLQAWLSLNCGVPAVSFSERMYTGDLMGVFRIDSAAVASSQQHAEDYRAPFAYNRLPSDT